MDGDSNDEEEQPHLPPKAPAQPDDSDPHEDDADATDDDADLAGREISTPPPAAGAGAPAPSSPGAVTLAAPGPPPSAKPLALALPITNPRHAAGAGAGGGREDCWSEGATETLIDAWGERYVHLSRGNLKHNHWQEVADAVTSRDNYRKPPKTDAQCKNRIDTLKKKYKQEKAKIAATGGSSPWPFFPKLDLLIGAAPPPTSAPPKKASSSSAASKKKAAPPPPPLLPPPAAAADKLPVTVPTRARSTRHYQPNSEESSDGLPPEMANGKRRRVERGGGRAAAAESVRELTRAIERFGEVYERVERTKLKQAVEMEKQRMNLVKELELQRIQFYMKTQMEINSLQS